MKPFKSSEFISNEETPVVSRHNRPVEILTVKGRGKKPVIGYVNNNDAVSVWCNNGRYHSLEEDQWDLFFATKLEVVHVYHFRDDKEGWFTLVHDAKIKEGTKMNANYTYLGTITGPIVPPEKSEVAK
jgi:hypothetical protein